MFRKMLRLLKRALNGRCPQCSRHYGENEECDDCQDFNEFRQPW